MIGKRVLELDAISKECYQHMGELTQDKIHLETKTRENEEMQDQMLLRGNNVEDRRKKIFSEPADNQEIYREVSSIEGTKKGFLLEDEDVRKELYHDEDSIETAS